MTSRYFIKVKANFFIITVIIMSLTISVLAKDKSTKDKLLENIIILKEEIKNLEEMIKQEHFGGLNEEIEKIKEELDKMVGDKSKHIEQIEEELSNAADEAKQERIRQIEEKLNEKARKEKVGK